MPIGMGFVWVLVWAAVAMATEYPLPARLGITFFCFNWIELISELVNEELHVSNQSQKPSGRVYVWVKLKRKKTEKKCETVSKYRV